MLPIQLEHVLYSLLFSFPLPFFFLFWCVRVWVFSLFSIIFYCGMPTTEREVCVSARACVKMQAYTLAFLLGVGESRAFAV